MDFGFSVSNFCWDLICFWVAAWDVSLSLSLLQWISITNWWTQQAQETEMDRPAYLSQLSPALLIAAIFSCPIRQLCYNNPWCRYQASKGDKETCQTRVWPLHWSQCAMWVYVAPSAKWRLVWWSQQETQILYWSEKFGIFGPNPQSMFLMQWRKEEIGEGKKLLNYTMSLLYCLNVHVQHSSELMMMYIFVPYYSIFHLAPHSELYFVHMRWDSGARSKCPGCVQWTGAGLCFIFWTFRLI